MRGSFISRKHIFDYLLYFFILVLLFAMASSFRLFGKGVDYNGYIAIFYGEESTEPAFRLLKTINSFVNSGQMTLCFVYFVCAFAGLYLKGKFYMRYSNSFLLSILLYLPTIYLLHEYTQIRAAVGLGICYLTVDEINERQFKRFALRVLFAMCFHYSAAVMFPVYFYCNLFKKPKRYIQILWISFFCSVLLYKFLHGQSFLTYLGSTFYSGFSFLGKLGALQNMNGFSVFNVCYLLILLLNTMYYIIYHGFLRKDNNFTVFQLSSLSAIIFYVLFNIGFHVVTFRLSEFFIPFLFIVIPKIIARFKEKFLLSPFVLVILLYYTRTFAKAVLS